MGAVTCCSLFLLTGILLVTSSRSKAAHDFHPEYEGLSWNDKTFVAKQVSVCGAVHKTNAVYLQNVVEGH